MSTLSGSFNSRKKHFLYFHDLKYAIELPAGVCAIYPSSLLLHSNISLVEADGEDEVLSGGGIPRGSLVWFCQASYVVLSELGKSIQRAKKDGEQTTFEGVFGLFTE